MIRSRKPRKKKEKSARFDSSIRARQVGKAVPLPAHPQAREGALAALDRDLAEVDGRGIKRVIRARITLIGNHFGTEQMLFYEGLLWGTEENGYFILLTDSLLGRSVTIKIKRTSIVDYQSS